MYLSLCISSILTLLYHTVGLGPAFRPIRGKFLSYCRYFSFPPFTHPPTFPVCNIDPSLIVSLFFFLPWKHRRRFVHFAHRKCIRIAGLWAVLTLFTLKAIETSIQSDVVLLKGLHGQLQPWMKKQSNHCNDSNIHSSGVHGKWSPPPTKK